MQLWLLCGKPLLMFKSNWFYFGGNINQLIGTLSCREQFFFFALVDFAYTLCFDELLECN